jgi:hypothetical protein
MTALICTKIELWSVEKLGGELVLYPFGRSSSTLIAFEKTGRKARLLESAYVDAAVRRWQFTGSKRFVSGAAARSTRSPPEERLKVQRLCCASRIERPL